MAIILRKALEELKSRSLEELGTKDLLFVIQQLDNKMRQEISSLQYYTWEYDTSTQDFLDEKDVEVALPFVY